MSYVIETRRRLHQYPEIGFDLSRTLSLVKEELDSFGISYTEKYGKSSIVATINEEKSEFTIGIRADMDALPIWEKNEVSYKSQIDGQMHACGHDAHTAILLDTARRLNDIKNHINCRIKLIFQASEEFPPGGAKLMVEDGLMDDIDCVVALHCDPKYNTGTIGILKGPQNAISHGFHLIFHGKSAHVAYQEKGIDAIAMAVKAYTAIELMVAKELPANSPKILNIGTFNGGVTNNVICDYSSMYCSVRAWDEKTEEKMITRIKAICEAIANENGGRFEFTEDKYYPMVNNDDLLSRELITVTKDIVGEKNVVSNERTMEGEDFSFFTRLKPGAMFRLGVKNENKGCSYSLHQNKFNIDEDALEIGSNIFIQFVKNTMNGIRRD